MYHTRFAITFDKLSKKYRRGDVRRIPGGYALPTSNSIDSNRSTPPAVHVIRIPPAALRSLGRNPLSAGARGTHRSMRYNNNIYVRKLHRWPNIKWGGIWYFGIPSPNTTVVSVLWPPSIVLWRSLVPPYTLVVRLEAFTGTLATYLWENGRFTVS
jgi:hypothetical protein